ncbi:conserved hypothetical protein [Mesorhizobium plurifarium]|uniref:Protein kinase domain-containing protein n=1 Tax=Mesorhizobium plurifarium TaxID=69974 RepID=A0A090GK26_MESPL|nr:conserved hypothetical protein [Mesorhizobium plurifarium]
MTSPKPLEVFTLRGEVIKLGPLVGQGGEGAVYELAAHQNHVAKVYHKPLDQQRIDKIRAMAKIKTDSLEKLTAWPSGLICAKDQKPIGLIMPKISGRKSIHQLYSPKSRRTDFQRVDWRFLARAAANTARAFAAVHDNACVIGDVNHGGILVAQDATVRLIDCDSFQVSYLGQQYLCEVGIETFTPPELQNRPFAGIVRTPNHDNFGLAVLTFLLLFMGRHPFAGRYNGPEDMPIPKAIEQYRFPYGMNAASAGMSRPPSTPELSVVGPKLAGMFERAFSRQGTNAGRPVARDWIAALAEFEANLKQCSANSSHWSLGGSPCPWCKMEGSTGVPLFSTSVPAGGATLFDIVGFQRQVDAVAHPGPAPDIPQKAVSATPDAQKLKGHATRAKVIAGVAAAVLVVSGIALGGQIWFFGGAVGVFLILKGALGKDKEAGEIRRSATEAAAQWDKAHATWLERAGAGAFEKQKARIASLRQEWDALPSKRTAKLSELERNRRKAQMDRYLDNFEIAHAKIEGVGQGKKQILESYGIETALDVEWNKLMNVPGFGPKTSHKIVSWRTGLERRFVFDPKKAIDPRDIAQIDQAIMAEQKRLQGALITALEQLKQIKAQVIAVREQTLAEMERLRLAADQAAANAAVVST